MKTLQELKDKYGNITIHLATKERAGELVACLMSLKSQTYNLWDIIICDDGSQTPTMNHQIVFKLIDRLRLEGRKIKILRNEQSQGVCRVRQRMINEDRYNNLLVARIDDDVILENQYLEKLVRVIDAGYDLASGITPLLQSPEIKRHTRFIKPIIDEIQVDDEGRIIKYADDCGTTFIEEEILPLHHFRSNALYKREITNSVSYPQGLNWFREESFFSIKAILAGYLLGCHTGAIAYHYMNQGTGGCRPQYRQDIINLDQQNWEMWFKREFLRYKDKHGTNFLEDYNKKLKEKGLLK